ncbi:P-type ATPase [Mycena floridula]|nr:P-type ATPase [Mycena floridula]
MSNIAGSSSGPSFDYTEGALPVDIDAAALSNRRARRESRYGDDGEGAMFAGPGHSVNPSSVSRMAHDYSTRRSLDSLSRTRRHSQDSRRPSFDRRRSTDSQVSRQSIEGQVETDNEEQAEEEALLRGRRQPRTSVFGNLASLFGRTATADSLGAGRRPSVSQRSTASASRRSRRSDAGSDYALDTDDEQERWGYSSGEETESSEESVHSFNTMNDNMSITASMAYDSDPPSPSMAPSLPLLASDPVFGGESRIDMEVPFTDLEPPPLGPPSRQTIYIQDEDTTVRFIGYERVFWRHIAWIFGCTVSLGILGLLGHWFPRLWLRWVAKEKAFVDSYNGFVVVESSHGGISLLPLKSLAYPYHVSTAFQESVDTTLFGPDRGRSSYDGESKMLSTLLYLDYRYSRFALDPRTGLFSMTRDWRDQAWTGATSVQDGLNDFMHHQRLTLFGPNAIDIQGKSTISLLVDEVIHPFYVFQIASIILWSLDDYYYYAFCIALISTLSITTTLMETKKTIARMRDMSRFSCKLHVLVDRAWTERDSAELVPGDVVNLSGSQLALVPCDMFLLSGDAIINESMLTGESIPVSKIPAKDEDLIQWRDGKEENAKSFLYGGTRIVRIRGVLAADAGPGRPAIAVVARIGFGTTKGALVRSMLFPKPIGFKFYRDSVRFIGVLACIAGLGFSVSAVQFIRIGVKWHTILIRGLDLITVVVPPALPATLSIGTSFAIGRLRRLGIYCISPSRINISGKVNVCCFDKTGTLTEDGLDILGVRGLGRNVQRFGELLENVHDIPLGQDKATFLYALATCHSLKMVAGEIIGDPLDAKMFEFTRWTLEEGAVAGTGVIKTKAGLGVEHAALVQTVVRPPGSAQFRLEDALKGASRHAHFLELGVIRTFEFVSALRRMSVVVKRLRSTSMEIYVKGAPEVMVDICEKDSFPEDYDDLLSYYTRRGYRVIAIAGKSIQGLSWLKAQRMKREQAETGLRFLGLVIFENKIKPGTGPAIHALRSAHLACRMITGDNPLTAVSVARECGLINQVAHVFSPAFIRGNAATPTSKLEWSCMDDFEWKLDRYSLKPTAPPAHHTVDEDDVESQDYSLVVTGDVFRWMINYAPLETLQRMLVKAQIFARMSPDEKNEIVERLQGLGYTVLMCGDGANDCAALKAADVGISLSEAEASVAAPFTSSTADIGCVLDLIKEGRAALVTSFSCFKYMALYSLIQFTSVTLLYSFASSLGDFQFLYIDLFIIIPVAVTMGRTLPYERIYPKRPTASLVSKKVLSSIIGQILISSVIQLWAYLWVRQQDWYSPPPQPDPTNNGDKLESQNFENTVLFLISCFQYILVAAVFSIGPPYRQSMWTNWLLMLALGSLSLFNVLVLLSPPDMVSDILTLMPLPAEGRIVLLIAAGLNVAISLCFEAWGAQRVAMGVGQISKFFWKGGRRTRVEGNHTYKSLQGL